MNPGTLPQTVDEAIQDFCRYYSSRDPKALFTMASPSFLGVLPGSEDPVLTAEELHTVLCRNFSGTDQVLLELSDLHTREEIRAAWMMAVCTLTTGNSGDTQIQTGRISAVFRRTIGGWQIALIHIAMNRSPEA
jgi:ketosteroid isomerase-like protein